MANTEANDLVEIRKVAEEVTKFSDLGFLNTLDWRTDPPSSESSGFHNLSLRVGKRNEKPVYAYINPKGESSKWQLYLFEEEQEKKIIAGNTMTITFVHPFNSIQDSDISRKYRVLRNVITMFLVLRISTERTIHFSKSDQLIGLFTQGLQLVIDAIRHGSNPANAGPRQTVTSANPPPPEQQDGHYTPPKPSLDSNIHRQRSSSHEDMYQNRASPTPSSSSQAQEDNVLESDSDSRPRRGWNSVNKRLASQTVAPSKRPYGMFDPTNSASRSASTKRKGEDPVRPPSTPTPKRRSYGLFGRAIPNPHTAHEDEITEVNAIATGHDAARMVEKTVKQANRRNRTTLKDIFSDGSKNANKGIKTELLEQNENVEASRPRTSSSEADSDPEALFVVENESLVQTQPPRNGPENGFEAREITKPTQSISSKPTSHVPGSGSEKEVAQPEGMTTERIRQAEEGLRIRNSIAAHKKNRELHSRQLDQLAAEEATFQDRLSTIAEGTKEREAEARRKFEAELKAIQDEERLARNQVQREMAMRQEKKKAEEEEKAKIEQAMRQAQKNLTEMLANDASFDLLDDMERLSSLRGRR